MLKIYGADLSSPANKVRFVANFLELEYEYIPVRIREGENRKEEYLKINPIGKIPAIDDSGFTLFESGAIIRYLSAKHKSELYPQDIKKRAMVDQWTDFVALHINMAMSKIIFNKIFYQFAKEEKDERSLQDGIKFLARFLPSIDTQLAKSRYLALDTITIADMTLLSSLDPAEITQTDLSIYPNIVKWRQELKKQKFYTKCYAKYGEPLERAMAK